MIEHIIIFCTTILTILILLYWFIYYLQWAQCYKSKADLELLSNTHTSSWKDSIIPSHAILDSQNRIRYLVYYNASKNNIDISSFDGLGYKCS